jgi:hypothetical protein
MLAFGTVALCPVLPSTAAAVVTPAVTQAEADLQRAREARRLAEVAEAAAEARADAARELAAMEEEEARLSRRIAELRNRAGEVQAPAASPPQPRPASVEIRSAQTSPPRDQPDPRTDPQQQDDSGNRNRNTQDRAEQQNSSPPGRQRFGGIEFGVGLSFTLDVGSSDRVRDAMLVNGVVRVKDEDNGVARIMLESHYFFTPHHRGLFGTPSQQWGHGPFVAIQPGTDNIIQAIGAGWMIGFRRPELTPGENTGQSFNIGLGVVVDPNTRILGDGIRPNQPLPAGETEIRYTEEMQIGALLLFSFSF